jgi:hypothetical protein
MLSRMTLKDYTQNLAILAPCIIIWFLYFLSLFHLQYWGLNSGFAMQVFYHLSHFPNPFAFIFFLQIGSHALPRLPADCHPPTSVPRVPGNTSVQYHTWQFLYFPLTFSHLLSPLRLIDKLQASSHLGRQRGRSICLQDS